MAKKKFKRLVILSDIHAGSQVGLTPPDFQYQESKHDVAKKNKYARLQRECWDWFSHEIKALYPIDVLVCNGDAIDGPGWRSGGTELITTDLEKQCEIAIEVIKEAKAKKHVFTYGTPYHAGETVDFENLIAKEFNAKIGSHEWLNINGTIFDFKHFIGNSSTPQGKFSSAARENLWSVLWANTGYTPKSNVLIRSHIHHFTHQGDGDYLAMTTPALQAMGTKYGSRKCSNIVHFGFVYFDIYEDGTYDWHFRKAKLVTEKVVPLII